MKSHLFLTAVVFSFYSGRRLDLDFCYLASLEACCVPGESRFVLMDFNLKK